MQKVFVLSLILFTSFFFINCSQKQKNNPTQWDANAFPKTYDTLPEVYRTTLEQADSFELFSLHPEPLSGNIRRGRSKDPLPFIGHFHDYEILADISVREVEDRKSLISAFYQSIEENDGMAADCFNPRHGIRVTQAGKSVDFLICFECYQFKAFNGKEKVGGLLMDSAAPVFNRFFNLDKESK